MRHPITGFNFRSLPNGDYGVQVDFPRDGSLRRGAIGEIYKTGPNHSRRWAAVLFDGTGPTEVFDTRREAALALLRDAHVIFVNGRARYTFTETGIKEVN